MFASAGVLGVATFGGITAASAAPTDDTEALGEFIGGTVLGTNLDNVADLQGAHAENPSGEELVRHPLSAEALNAITVDLGDGISLLGDNGIAEVGAVNQYAEAAADGAHAASGAVNDQGAIEVGGSEEFPADATIGLTQLIADLGLEGVISEASVTAGAVSSEAHWEAGGEPTGDYQIASLTIDLESPLVGGILGPVFDILEPVLGEGVGTAEVDGVLVDLTTGEVRIDLAALLSSQGLDINNLPADTELISGEVVSALTQALVQAITGAVTDILELPTLPIVGDVEGTLNEAVATVADDVVAPLVDGINQLVSLQANVQDQPGDIAAHDPSGTESFTQRALLLTVLPEAETPVAEVELASSTVRTFVEDGQEVDGTEVDGTEVDGTEVDGTEVDGTEVDGTEVDGTEVDGTEVDGTEVDGTEVDGTEVDGTEVDGTEVDGTEVDGTEVDGTEVDGTEVDGTAVDGTEVDGTAVDGTEVDGGMLPQTGAGIAGLIAAFVVLVGGGAAAVIYARRRRALQS